MDRDVDRTWSVWLTSQKRRHGDQTILEAITRVVEGGEKRPKLVRELVRDVLEQLVRSPA